MLHDTLSQYIKPNIALTFFKISRILFHIRHHWVLNDNNIYICGSDFRWRSLDPNHIFKQKKSPYSSGKMVIFYQKLIEATITMYCVNYYFKQLLNLKCLKKISFYNNAENVWMLLVSVRAVLQYLCLVSLCERMMMQVCCNAGVFVCGLTVKRSNESEWV